jgi:hypothetical protein
MRSLWSPSKRVALALFLAVAGGSIATAMSSSFIENQTQPGHEYVDVEVAMSHDGIAPGETILVGFTFFLDEGWHTYWPGSSDSGYGVTLNTIVPESITLGEQIWPTPHRHIAPGDILDHVYEDQFTVLVPMTLAEGSEIGTPITVTTDISYLVCKDMCLPGQVSVEYGLQAIDPNFERMKTPDDYDRLTKLYEQRVVSIQHARPDASVTLGDGSAQIHIPGASSIVFYPSSRCVELPALIGEGKVHSDTMVLHFDPHESDSLEGRLEVTNKNGQSNAYSMRVPAVAE